MANMHDIDYKIFGDDMQFVEVELDPNEATVAEAGGMMYMDDGIEMETIVWSMNVIDTAKIMATRTRELLFFCDIA